MQYANLTPQVKNHVIITLKGFIKKDWHKRHKTKNTWGCLYYDIQTLQAITKGRPVKKLKQL